MVLMDAQPPHMDSSWQGPAARRHGIIARVARPDELPEVLRVQIAGFRRVARRFGFADVDMPPLRETLDDLTSLLAKGMHFFVALADEGPHERVVGTVRAVLREDCVVEIGRLAVDDTFERRGVATLLMSALEMSFSDTRRFELFTGSEAEDALALYDHLGYRVFRHDDFGDWTRVWLAKDRAGATVTDDRPLD
jgi:ribosomal protein S18 acetylase RimI-like enzyme